MFKNSIYQKTIRHDFLKVGVLCKKVDQFGKLNDSKNKTITSKTVISYFYK